MKDLIFLKLGGSVITQKDVTTPQINLNNLKRISKEIAESYHQGSFNLVIVHGAGSFGHPIVKKTGIHEGITTDEQVFSFAQTQLLQNELNCKVCEILQKFKLPAIPVQPSASAIMDRKRLISLHHDLIQNLLSLSLIPVLFGVPAFDKTQKCSILSGDQILVYLAKQLQPTKLIFASNVDGVLGANQEVIKKITPLNYSAVQNLLYDAKYDDVTGSMRGKIAELAQLKGIKSYIINGNKPGIITDVLNERFVRGTVIEF
ncbi:MAG: isopentenyl phosphate kinase [Candidatus Helarchaeota archaeon]